MLWCFGRFGVSACRKVGVGGLDGFNRDERHCKQGTDARDVLGADWAGKEAVVTDAMEALWQDMHQEAAGELVRIEGHHSISLVTFDAIVLPLEGDALVIERDQAAIGDGDAMGVAREVAQDFLGAPEWAFAVDDPLCVTQRRQIGHEGSRIRE